MLACQPLDEGRPTTNARHFCDTALRPRDSAATCQCADTPANAATTPRCGSAAARQCGATRKSSLTSKSAAALRQCSSTFVKQAVGHTSTRQCAGARDAGRLVAWMSVGFAQTGTRMATSTVARNGQLIRRFHSAGNSPTWHFANETHIAPTNARPHAASLT